MSKHLINGKPIEFGNLEQIKFLQDAERKIQEHTEAVRLRKNMNPFEKALDSYANIGYSHFAIDNLKKLVAEKLKTKHPIEDMVNKATGYDKGVVKAFITILRGHYKELVKNHRYLGDDDQVVHFKGKIAAIDKELRTFFKGVNPAEL